MNTVNFEPKGIYQQFASSKAAPFKVQNNISAENKESFYKQAKETSRKKYAKYTAGLALIAGGIFLRKQYKKGIDAMNLKEKVLSNIKNQEEFNNFIKSKPFSTLEIQEFKKIWSEYNRYKTNAVGVVHSFFESVSNFFKNNFYNY